MINNDVLSKDRAMLIWGLFLLMPLIVLADDRHYYRYQPFCNYVCDSSVNDRSCPDPVEFEFAPCNQTQTGNHCTLDGCKVWTQGIFPMLVPAQDQYDDPTWTSKDGTEYRVINGGVPQYANFTLHLDTLIHTIDDWIPPLDFDGNMVLDFEAWTPLWDYNTNGIQYHSKVYQEYSLDRMAQEHPSWNPTRIETEAARVFQTAGVEFFVATLLTLQKLRPQASVGFYGYPFGHYRHCTPPDASDRKEMRCGYDNPTAGPALQRQNDAIAPIYQASTALFPSVYLQPQGDLSKDLWRTFNLKYVNDTVHEAIRLIQTYRQVPIWAFHWGFYHSGTGLLLPEDVSMVARYTYVPPYSLGVVQWGTWGTGFGPWQTNFGGPLMKQAVDQVEKCSKRNCNNHGWCTQSTAYPDMMHHSAGVDPCICDEGYHGAVCGLAVA